MVTGSSGSKRKPRTERPEVSVLRVGHRPGRDPRLTTHLALTARAFGAQRMLLHPPDPDLALRVAAVGKGWGGSFEVIGVPDWRRAVRSFDGPVVHLTMYGLPLARVLPKLEGSRRDSSRRRRRESAARTCTGWPRTTPGSVISPTVRWPPSP